MEDDYHKAGLYRWKRQTKPRIHSRAQKVTTTDDIKHWIEKVEAASNLAAEAVLGRGTTSGNVPGRVRGQQAVREMSDNARIQNEAYEEAEELLRQWISEKVIQSKDGADPDADVETDDPWRQQELGSKARRKWNSMLNGNFEEFSGMEFAPNGKRENSLGPDPFANLYNMEEDEAVSTVIKTMLEKEVVRSDFKKDLGFESDQKFHDPRSKMELRHQRVRENREKREQELEKKKKEAEVKKQARLTAHQMVMKEEKDRYLQAKQEELQIRQQMSAIRKEMAEQHKAQMEEKLRLKHEQEVLARQAQAELERQQALERQEMVKQCKENELKLTEMAQQELAMAKEAALRLKVLHKHFLAWHNIAIQRRLQLGKARALADWRLMLRVWNAWRSLVRSQHLALETEQHQKNVAEENSCDTAAENTHEDLWSPYTEEKTLLSRKKKGLLWIPRSAECRKNLIATRHHHTLILHHYFNMWREWVIKQQDQRALQKVQQETRTKMLNLLKTVTEVGLGSAPPSHTSQRERDGTDSKKSRSGPSTHRSGSEKASTQEPNLTPPKDTTSPTHNIVHSASATSVSSQGHSIPREAWQVTKKHVKLTKEEIKNLSRDPSNEQQYEEVPEHDDLKIRRRFGTQPWMNRRYVVNNFEHRFIAQQKLLHTQQTEIREQRRLLQELMSVQQVQSLQQNLCEQHERSGDDHVQDTEEDSPVKGPSSARSEKRIAGREGASKQMTIVRQKLSPDTSRTDRSAAREFPPTHQDVISRGGTCRSEVPTFRSDHSSSTVSQNHSNKYLQVLENMDKRAKERARLKAERDEKRRRAEEERLERLKQEEEDHKKKEEEEKRARVLAYKEKKQQEKQKEQERQNELQRQTELSVRADEHYRKALMKFWVLVPLKKMVVMAQEKMKAAEQHHNLCVMRLTIKAWKTFTDEVTAEKKRLADELYGYIIVRHCFKSWKSYKYRAMFLERRAERFYSDLIVPKAFDAWRQFTNEEKKKGEQQMQKAAEFFPLNLQRKVFRAWQRFPKELQREAEREKLRAEMRRKVADLLPDFQPLQSVNNSTDSFNFS